MRGRFNGRYSKEFRIEAVKMVVEGGVSAYEASRQLSLPKSTLENWVRAFKAGKLSDIGGQQRPLTEVEQELDRVKRELAQVKQERDILKKAAAYFAKESLPTEELNALREERLVSLSPPSDLRRIDEPVFWELISKARSQAPSTLEQLIALGVSLRAFKAVEIKRFGALYAKLMKQLYHWNVWALAYAARGGCSDGAFEEFRAWLILQGDPALVKLAVTNPTQAAKRVPPDPDLPDGPGLSTIEEAYFQRKGASLELPSTDLDKPKGKEWSEAAFATIHPQLVRHYASVDRA